jgi:oxygen-independent coproporphyrinogen-3 oxidase
LSALPAFDADLLGRYDRPGPRYTSYPTAPQFRESFGEPEFREHARRTNEGSIARPISLYVHVPYCFSPCFYCGCNRIITRERAKGVRYVELLRSEIERAAPLFDADREVIQLHLGGGTPNFLHRAELARVLDILSTHFNLSTRPDRDFSIELDPRFADRAEIQALADLGFNRVSLGVQDFDPEVQRAVNRVQTVEQTLAVIDACRTNGMRSVNVDLIYGLPKQSLAGFARTLETVIAAAPDRLAVYGYAHLPELFKPQRQIEAADLPGRGERLALLSLAIEALAAAGYRYIGMDHFAKPDDDLARAQDARRLHRNFMGYTTHAGCDLLGLGVSAISHVGDSFSQNHRALPDWERALGDERLPLWRGLALTEDDVLRAEVIQQLMCHGEVDTGAIENRYGIRFWDYFADAAESLEPLVADDLVRIEAGHITARPRGRLLVRMIAMSFDRYLNAPTRKAAHPARFSKVL